LRPVPGASFDGRYPSLAAWIAPEGWIELGDEPHTDTDARALDEGGMIGSGGRRTETTDEWLAALEAGVREWMDIQGLR
jgi:hypothetical protein